MIRDKTKTRQSSFLLALFIMQYTLILPFTKVMSATLLTAGTSLMILLAFLVVNRRIRFNFYFILILSGILFALILKLLLFPSDAGILLVFAYTAFPAAFAAVYDYDPKIVMGDLYRLSKYSFWLVFWYPFVGQSNYMRFGYAVLPAVLFILCDLLYNKKKKRTEKIFDVLLSIVLLIEMVVFGARGSFFSLLLFFAIEEVLINRRNIGRKICLALIALIAYLNIVNILDWLYGLLSSHGIHSYAIIKYRMQLNRGFDAASSGRSVMYDVAFEELLRSPFWGLPIQLTSGEDSAVADVTYVHNLFLQTWMDLGIIGLIVLVVFLFSVIWKIGKKNIDLSERILIAALLSISVGRLMFSSVIWRRPEFWLLVFMSVYMGKRQSADVA